MKKNKLNLGINQIKNITMTKQEKSLVFENILKSVNKKSISTPSPWFSYTFLFNASKKQLVYFIFIPLFFIISSGGVVFASQNSLPSDILYPLKTKFIEPMKGIFIVSPINKAVYESKLASKRLTEANKLITKGDLDLKKEEKILNLFNKHTNNLNIALLKIDESKNENEDKKDKIITDFSAEMNSSAKILDINNEKHEKEIQDSQVNYNLKISDEVRNKVKKIKKNSNNSNSKSYKNRKDDLKILIDKTEIINEINKNIIDSSTEQNKIRNNAQTVLNNARIYLEESESKETEGKQEEAYKLFIDSESSVKEANIYIKKRNKY